MFVDPYRSQVPICSNPPSLRPPSEEQLGPLDDLAWIYAEYISFLLSAGYRHSHFQRPRRSLWQLNVYSIGVRVAGLPVDSRPLALPQGEMVQGYNILAALVHDPASHFSNYWRNVWSDPEHYRSICEW